MKQFLSICSVLLAIGMLPAQSDTVNLNEVTVESPLWQKAGVGQNRVLISESELDGANNASLAAEISVGTPVNITGTGYGLLANPVIRGTHANGTQVYWNGMPVNSPTLGTSDLNLYRSSAFNQISIIPGGSGTELGGGSMGGAILLDRNLNFDQKNKLSIGGSLASYAEAAGQASYSYSKETFAFSAGVSHFQTENDFPFTTIYGENAELDNAAIRSSGAFASAAKRWGGTSVESHLLWQNHHRQIPDSRSSYNSAKPSEALQTDQQIRWQNILKSKRWRIEQGFGLEQQTYRDERYFQDDRYRFGQVSSEVEYQAYKNDRIVWLVGGYSNFYSADGSRVSQEQVEYGFRTSAVLQLSKKLLLKPAIAESFLDDRAMAFLPSLATEYYLSQEWTLKAKTGKVFSVPTLNQRYWPGAGVIDILPESGWNTEVSAQYKNDRHRVVAALYYNHLENKVFWLPAPLGARPRNFRKVRTLGAELIGNSAVSLAPQWELKVRYSANYSRPQVSDSYLADDAVVGNVLIYVPTFTGDLEAAVRFKDWETSLAGEYNNGAFTDYDNSELMRLDGFFLLHWRLSWSYGRGNWRLKPGAEMLNLLNEDYELYFNRPMPGRVFRIFLNLNYNF